MGVLLLIIKVKFHMYEISVQTVEPHSNVRKGTNYS